MLIRDWDYFPFDNIHLKVIKHFSIKNNRYSNSTTFIGVVDQRPFEEVLLDLQLI